MIKQTKISVLLTSAFAAFTLLASPVQADDAADLDKQVAAMDKQSTEVKDDRPMLEEVSKKTGVPTEQLEKQQRETKMGAGSLFIANTLAKKTGKSFEEIVAARGKKGNGWGKVAKDNGVKLGPLMSDAKKMEKQQRDKAGKKADGPSKRDESKSKGKPDKSDGKKPEKDKEKGKDKGDDTDPDSGSKGKSKKK